MSATNLICCNNYHPSLKYEEDGLHSMFKAVFAMHPPRTEGNLSIAFLESEAHCKIHSEFLNDSQPTDVITFPADQEEGLIGEICISVDQAIEKSRELDLSLEYEISLYLVHGWLHLTGFDDMIESERSIMKEEEARVMLSLEKSSLLPNFRLA